jgi:phage replication-related protein YjqB (UPF0714/DUF867 family)
VRVEAHGGGHETGVCDLLRKAKALWMLTRINKRRSSAAASLHFYLLQYREK